jgi:hypothetical protein
MPYTVQAAFIFLTIVAMAWGIAYLVIPRK